MAISRVGGLSQPNRTLEQCKAEVDNALLTGEWVIFEDHAGYGFYGSQDNLDLLRELIQYVKTKGVRIVNIREGVQMKANIIDVGEVSDSNYFRLARDGSAKSPSMSYQTTHDENLSNQSPVSYFERKVTETPVPSSRADGFPENRAGTLVTHRQRMDNADDFAYQLYYIYDRSTTYKRRWNKSAGEWGVWERFDGVWKFSEDNIYNNDTPISEFPNYQV